MAVQKEIAVKTVTITGIKKKTSTGEEDATLTIKTGTLALGKPGDIINRAYGPVAFAKGPLAADTAFGTYVEGKGILVNSNDCAGIGNFDTTESGEWISPFDGKTLKKGSVGTFLVSGSCVVLKSQVPTIAAKMVVVELDAADYNASKATDVVAITVNGFDSDQPSSVLG